MTNLSVDEYTREEFEALDPQEKEDYLAIYKEEFNCLPPYEISRRRRLRRKAENLKKYRARQARLRRESTILREREIYHEREERWRLRHPNPLDLQPDPMDDKEWVEGIRNQIRDEQHAIEKNESDRIKNAERRRLKELKQRRRYYRRVIAPKLKALRRRRRKHKKWLELMTLRRRGVAIYKDFVRELILCNLPPEKRQDYLDRLHQLRRRLPWGYNQASRRIEREIRKREQRKESRRARRERIKERRKQRRAQRRMEKMRRMWKKKMIAKYGYIPTEEEKKQWRNRKAVIRKYENKTGINIAEREAQGDSFIPHTIYRCKNRKKHKSIYRSRWKLDALKYFDNMLQENRDSVKIPNLRKDCYYEILLTRKKNENEDSVSYLRDESGKMVGHFLAYAPNNIVIRKEKIYIEEQFNIYSFKGNEKKDFNYIYNEILIKSLSDNIRVFTHNQKLFILSYDEIVGIISNQSQRTIYRLYNTLQEECEKNNVGVFFLGEMYGITWEKFLVKLLEYTGWDEVMVNK